MSQKELTHAQTRLARAQRACEGAKSLVQQAQLRGDVMEEWRAEQDEASDRQELEAAREALNQLQKTIAMQNADAYADGIFNAISAYMERVIAERVAQLKTSDRQELEVVREAVNLMQKSMAVQKEDAAADAMFTAVNAYIDRVVGERIAELQATVRYPAHRWNGTRLQFEIAPGVWGEAVDLQGRAGAVLPASFFDKKLKLDAGGALDENQILDGGGAGGAHSAPGFGGGGAGAVMSNRDTANAGRAY